MRRRRVYWRFTAKALLLALAVQWCGVSIAQPRVTQPAPNTTVRIAILDFEIPAGQSPLLGRKAADAVAVAFLTQPKVYELISRANLDEAMQRLRLMPPLTLTQISQLTKELQARYAVTGKVVKVSVNEKVGQASVQLQVLFYDPYMETFVNGGHVLVTSPPRPGLTPDVLTDQALNLAALEAINQALTTRLPEAQITQRVEKTVLINKGRDQGIYEGMEMWVFRYVRDPVMGAVPSRIGRITIKESGARTSEGVIEEEISPIQYPDRVVAVYQLPRILDKEPPIKVKKKGMGSQISKLLLLFAAVFFVGNLVKSGNAKRGERSPGNFSSRVSSDGQSVVVNLNTYEELVAIEIYRDTSPSINPGGTQPIDILDAQATKTFVDNTTFYAGDGVVEINTDNPPNIIPRLQKDFDPNEDPEYSPIRYARVFFHGGIQLGNHYWYVVRYVTARRLPRPPVGGGGGQLPFELIYSPFSASFGPTTPVRRLGDNDLLEPATNADVNFGDVSFRFLSALGADEYVVQVSDSVNFPADRTLSIPNPLLPNPDIDAQPITIRAVNLLNRFFGQPPIGSIFFWRVGYRYSRDMLPPEGGFVFSLIRPFRVAESPPPPPG